MLKIKLIITVFIACFINQNIALADHVYKTQHHKNDYYHIMGEYIGLPENLNTKLQFISQHIDSATGVTRQEYSFDSQIWPKNGLKSEQKTWSHRVLIYTPQEVKAKNALLWINSGTRYRPSNNNTHSPLHEPYPLDFYKIAQKTKTVVIDLHDIPNQYITLNGNQYAEDALMAYTWSKFINDPDKNKYLPAYLPMVKAVVTTMDNISKLINIDSFIVGGFSKRGMTTWLTGLHDQRVKAIIPVSIDVLNFEENIKHIYASLQDWPVALHDYYEQNVIQQLSNNNAKYLMQVNDPYQYITCNTCSNLLKNKFKQRASIEKYIIAASGDDFFTPDSSLFYFNNLPGNNHIRYIPNSWHYIDHNIITNAVISYLDKINNKKPLPKFKSKLSKNLTATHKYFINIETDQKPKFITLYQAVNINKRDFRLASSIKYMPLTIATENYNPYLLKKYGIYKYKVSIDVPHNGWQASFIECEYDSHNAEIENLILTSNIEILPKNYPAEIKDKIKTALKNKIELVKQYGKKVIYN